MDWAQFAPVLLGILLGAVLTWGREDWLGRRREKREDAIRAEERAREDQLAERQRQHWVSQRWWERKAEAYTQIVEALWHLLEFSREVAAYLDARRSGTGTEEFNSEHQFHQHLAELRRRADIGAFVISDDVRASLENYLSAVGGADIELMEEDELVDLHLKQASICLDSVRAGALHDLGVSTQTLDEPGGGDVSPHDASARR